MSAKTYCDYWSVPLWVHPSLTCGLLGLIKKDAASSKLSSVRLPKNFPSAPVTPEKEADAISMGHPILRFWGGPDDAFICLLETGDPAVLAHLMSTPVRSCRSGDTTYLTRVTAEGLASNQDLCRANPRCSQVRLRESYTAPAGSECGIVHEMLVGSGNTYNV